MSTLAEMTQRKHRRAVRFFWCLLISATTVSLIGNVVHAMLPYIPRVAIQIGAAGVPPIVLLATVHGIALAVRAGASGTVYRSAVSATAVIGAGAFAMSFLALRDLMQVIGYRSATAWVFPLIVDVAIAVATVMLVALGDKPARRAPRVITPTAPGQAVVRNRAQSTKAQVERFAPSDVRAQTAHGIAAQTSASVQTDPAQTMQGSARPTIAPFDADLASELIASGVTAQPVETVIAVLEATRDGASINAAAKASGINYRTAKRIVEAAAKRQQRQIVAVV